MASVPLRDPNFQSHVSLMLTTSGLANIGPWEFKPYGRGSKVAKDPASFTLELYQRLSWVQDEQAEPCCQRESHPEQEVQVSQDRKLGGSL